MTTISGTAGTTAGSSVSAAKLTGDFNTFLTLLTTQLRNQDPSQPMDANEMSQQLVQFAGIEQQIAANRTLESLLNLQQAAALSNAAALVGSAVEVESERLSLQGGTAGLRLAPAGAAKTARITLRDGAGSVVLQREVALGATASDWRWDGKNAKGQAMPDGAYRVSVTGLDASGATASTSFTVLGRVTAAQRNANGVTLSLGAVTVGLDALRAFGS